MKYWGKSRLRHWEGIPVTRRQLIKGGAVGTGGVVGVLAINATAGASEGPGPYAVEAEPRPARPAARTTAALPGQFVSAGVMQPATDVSDASLLRPFDPLARSSTVQNVGTNPVRLAYSSASMWDFSHPATLEGFSIVLNPGEEFVDEASRSPLFAVAEKGTVLKFRFVIGGAA